MRRVPLDSIMLAGVTATVLVALAGVASADDPVPQRRGSVSSPSGEYSLRIEAKDDYLRSSARYTLTSKDKTIWSGEKPYTLRQMTVTDEGWVAGFAYRTASRRAPGGGKRKQYLHVVAIDNTGKEILNDVTERKPGPTISPGVVQHVPLAEQILVDPANDRIIVRGRDDDTPGDGRLDFWWIYRMSTGEDLKRFRPQTGWFDLWPVRRMVRIALVPDTDLVLVHWFLSSGGARFTLVTSDGGEVWRLELEEDYEGLPENTKRNLRPYLTQNPAILSTGLQGRFELRFFSANQRVTYAAEQVGESLWDVREVSRADFVNP